MIAVLHKRKWWLVGTLVVALAVGLVLTKRQTPVYRATATVIIEANPPRVLAGVKDVVELGPSSNYWSMREYFETQYKVIAGLEVCERVATALNLSDDPDFIKYSPDEILTAAEKTKRIADKVPARILQKMVTVEPIRDSMLARILVDDNNAQRAMDIANEFAMSYRAHNIEYRRSVTQEANSELRDMVERYRIRKEEADRKLIEFEKEHSIGSFESRKKSLEERLALLNEKQGQMLLKRSELGARVSRIKTFGVDKDLFSVPLDDVLSSSLVSSLKSKYVDIRDQRMSLEAQYGPQHPKLKSLNDQVVELESALTSEIKAHMASIRGDFDEVVMSLKDIDSLIANTNKELAELSTLQVEVNALAERKADASAVYDQVRARFTEIDLSAQVETNNVRIHELAQLPARPIKPDLRLNLLIALMIGLILGFGVSYLVEQLDNTVKGREELELLTGVPCLGLVPAIPGPRKTRDRRRDKTLKDRDFYVINQPTSVVAEALNSVRTNLMFVQPDREIKTVLITSGSSWEGKSTMAISFGVTEARYGVRTIIVDADMRRPRLHRAFGLTPEKGLSSVLVGGVNLKDVIVKTHLENLDVLPCGAVPPNPADLLSSRKFVATIMELRAMYDMVVIDSPPVIPVVDPRIIGSAVDAVLLVVKLGKTTHEALVQSCRELTSVGSNLVGTVLNEMEVRRGYGYGYGYGYGRYGYYSNRYYSTYKPEIDEDAGNSEST